MASRTWAEIDLNQLRKNLLSIEKAARGRKLALTIKANAYGHGSIPIAKHTEDKATLFVVADIDEAVELQDVGIEKPILVLKPLLGEDEIEEAISRRLRILLAFEEELSHIDEVAGRLGKSAMMHLEIDTGMARTGVFYDRVNPLFENILKAKNIKLEGVFTHFATADSDEVFVREQLFRFWKALKSIPKELMPLTIHTANSAALLEFPETLYDMVRPGILLYGLKPRVDRLHLDIHPILTWKTRVVQLKKVKKGQGISYGHYYIAPRDSTIAVLSVGYGDGYPRQLSNRAKVIIHSEYAPVVGMVTMDFIMVDVTDIKGVKVGDTAILLGREGDKEVSAKQMANWAETIHYEIVTRIAPRVKRIYIGAKTIPKYIGESHP